MAFRIKQIPEDFMVKEIMDIKNRLSPAGRFSYYCLRKRNYTSQKAVEIAARALRKKIKYVNFAGNKDRQAVTEQYISVLHGPAKSLELDGISLEFLGRGKERINLGDSEGNEFEIVVRNLDKKSCAMGNGHSTNQHQSGHPKMQIPNYYDEQRFGMNLNNHIIGRCIVKKEFDKAAGMVPECRGWLRKHPNDFVGALRSLPKRILRLYPHSYQSWLWNETAGEYLGMFKHRKIETRTGELLFPAEKVPDTRIPVIGYETMLDKARTNSEIRKITGRLMQREGIRLDDFRLKQFPEFDLKGGERNLFVRMRNLEIGRYQKDELNRGRNKVKVKFFLPKGSYATVVIEHLFGEGHEIAQ